MTSLEIVPLDAHGCLRIRRQDGDPGPTITLWCEDWTWRDLVIAEAERVLGFRLDISHWSRRPGWGYSAVAKPTSATSTKSPKV